MAALEPALLAHGPAGPLAPVLGFAFACPPSRDERSGDERSGDERSGDERSPQPRRSQIGQDGSMPEQTVALNRRARHEFSIEDTFEAGLVLTGTEIKSIRTGKVQLANAYARIERDEAWLIGAHIAPFEQANRYNHEPLRTRKLLLRRSEIDELLGKTKSKGLTIVPLRLYINDKGRAKLELGLARGKQQHDRRHEIADRDSRRDMARELADAQRGR
jgi:SsrA-binding protein